MQLRTTFEKSTAVFDKEKAQERLSKLSGGVAVFKVHLLPYNREFSHASFCPVLLVPISFHRLEVLVKQKLERGKIG